MLLQASVETYRSYRHVAWYTLFIVLYMLVLYYQVRGLVLQLQASRMCRTAPSTQQQQQQHTQSGNHRLHYLTTKRTNNDATAKHKSFTGILAIT